MKLNSGKTAMARKSMSLPLRVLIKAGYLDPGKHAVFDLGHGRGDDMKELSKRDFLVAGWDPNHHLAGFSVAEFPPSAWSGEYNFVYCGYVLNVLESREFRLAVVKDAYDFLKRGGEAAFAVRSFKEVARSRKDGWVEHNDGWITTTGTFQHGATPAEVVDLLDEAGFSKIHVVRKGPVIVYARK